MKRQSGLTVRRWILGVLILVLGVGLAGCGCPPPSPEITPAGPKITIAPGESMTIQATAERADNYEWVLTGDGEISATQGPAILYYASDGPGKALLTITAHNAQGASPAVTIEISVVPLATYALDALATPIGWMSGKEGDIESYISLESGSDCQVSAKCPKFTYKAGGEWGGVYWWPLTCGAEGDDATWEKVRNGTCGINVLQAGGFSTVHRLAFWARGDQGGEVIEFKIGGTDISPKPGRSLGKVSLKSSWEQYQIDLEGVDLTNAVGLFLWSATDIDNPEGAVFYLDDVRFEGMK